MKEQKLNEYARLPLSHLEFLRNLVLVLREKDRTENITLIREAGLIDAELEYRERTTKRLLSQLPS